MMFPVFHQQRLYRDLLQGAPVDIIPFVPPYGIVLHKHLWLFQTRGKKRDCCNGFIEYSSSYVAQEQLETHPNR